MKAWVKKNKMYFDKEAWDLIVIHARKSHKTVKQTVIAGLKRGMKRIKVL